jgi:hypothetical protein
VKCPTCGAEISWQTAGAHAPFICPECGHGVHLRDRYFRVLYLLALVLTWLVASAFGATGNVLFWSVILGVLPTEFVLTFLTLRLFPPDAESTGEFRGILYRHQPGKQPLGTKANTRTKDQ